MVIDTNIDTVIQELQNLKKLGYTTVEVIDKSRRLGWKKLNSELELIFNSNEPDVIGIAVPGENY